MDYEVWLFDEGGSMKMRVFGRGALSVCSNIWRRIRCTLSSAYKKLLRHKKIEADTVDDGAPVNSMAFFNSAVGVLQTLVVALGAGLGVWGVINLMEGYGNDNPGAKSQGMKQLMAGGGVALIGTQLIPLLSGLF